VQRDEARPSAHGSGRTRALTLPVGGERMTATATWG